MIKWVFPITLKCVTVFKDHTLGLLVNLLYHTSLYGKMLSTHGLFGIRQFLHWNSREAPTAEH